MSIFTGLINFFDNTIHGLTNGKVIKKVDAIAAQIDKVLPQALTVVKMIELMAPNTSAGRAAADVEKVAEKYQLHVTPEIIADPVQSSALLQNAALKELQHLTSNVPTHILNTAVTMAVSYMKATS